MPWANDREARQRSNATYGAGWKRARKAALERAGHRCERCGSRRELQVDHVFGAAADPEHRSLQVLCGQCHRSKTAREGTAARNGSRRNDPPVTPRTQWLSLSVCTLITLSVQQLKGPPERRPLNPSLRSVTTRDAA
jgi:5-methylcytosine-specific restriction endonuclease McrA